MVGTSPSRVCCGTFTNPTLILSFIAEYFIYMTMTNYQIQPLCTKVDFLKSKI